MNRWQEWPIRTGLCSISAQTLSLLHFALLSPCSISYYNNLNTWAISCSSEGSGLLYPYAVQGCPSGRLMIWHHPSTHSFVRSSQPLPPKPSRPCVSVLCNCTLALRGTWVCSWAGFTWGCNAFAALQSSRWLPELTKQCRQICSSEPQPPVHNTWITACAL